MSPEPPAAANPASDRGDSPPVASTRPGPRRASEVRTAADVRTLARNRLIESRLTPNTISVTGLVLNVVAAVVITVLGSLMVSYTRARAEALGVECKVGLATRPVRVVILSAGLLFARGASLGDFQLLAPAIYAMAVLTSFTVLQRVLHVRRALNKADRGLAAPPA